MSFGHKIRMAAGLPKGFLSDVTPLRRKIPKDHPYDPRVLKPMAKMLWALSISLGHALTAYRQFNRVKSVNVSPDGLLGGQGYIMSVVDIRKKLFEACEAISAISDTIHDEINAPHWKPRLADLDPNTVEDVERFIEEAKSTLSNPEEEAEEEMEGIERENDAKWKARGVRPVEDASKPASQIPTDGPGGQDHDQVFHGGWGQEQKDPGRPRYASDRLQGQLEPIMISDQAKWRIANSSVPVETLDGPRVDHVGPGEGRGPFGTYNRSAPEDAWIEDLDEHMDLGWSDPVAASGLPVDPTPTDADDFGIGYGRDGAASKDYGTTSEDGRGVFGPASGMPNDPGGRLHDTENGGATPSIETHLIPGGNIWASLLPTDIGLPVTRTDYYQGPKGNTVSLAELPNDEATYNYDRDLPNVGQTFEHTDNPYIKWDDSTHNYRPDMTFQRNPREEG